MARKPFTGGARPKLPPVSRVVGSVAPPGMGARPKNPNPGTPEWTRMWTNAIAQQGGYFQPGQEPTPQTTAPSPRANPTTPNLEGDTAYQTQVAAIIRAKNDALLDLTGQ